MRKQSIISTPKPKKKKKNNNNNNNNNLPTRTTVYVQSVPSMFREIRLGRKAHSVSRAAALKRMIGSKTKS